MLLVSMLVAGWLAINVWGPAFDRTFGVDEDHQHVAGLSLSVAAMSLVAMAMSLWNLLRVISGRKAVTVELPGWLKPYLAPLAATLVGILIGTTIFK